MNKILTILAFCTVTISTVQAQKKTGFHVINTFHIASTGGWDAIEVGPVNDWLYLSHGTQVNVLNKINGDSAGVIENTMGVHDIAFDVANHKGFTSNGKLNTVTVFDMNTNKVLAQIAVGQNPDIIFYEPFSKKIMVCNGRGKNISIIDPLLNRTIDSVDVGGKPEFAASNGTGKLYVNVEDKNEIVEIDTKSFKVLNHWSLAPGDGPTGLAMDKITNRLFSGCDKKLVVLDANNGKLIDTLVIGSGCDGVVFDPMLRNIYTANGEGTITVIHEDNANKFTVVENIETKKGARTLALDMTTHFLYLPTADFEPQAPGEKGRPKMKPGTFQVLVVGK